MKTIYVITKYMKEGDQVYYKYFEHKEKAENELKEIAKTYTDVKWNRYGDLIACNDHWTIKEITVH